ADEPTTALDVTVQAQIFDLLNEIQRDFGAAIILITHDMGAISEMADRVAVMYAGRVIEQGSADDVLDFPQHPYTRGLIDCIPALGREDHRLAEIPGVVPPLHLLGDGCAFAARCAHCAPRCEREKPILAKHGHHPAACHGVEEGWI
ncbi:oligopeptide/dipeptide ABC transporter ATP-binding protein, partial [Cribrihabitans sp. XS_ASV171]